MCIMYDIEQRKKMYMMTAKSNVCTYSLCACAGLHYCWPVKNTHTHTHQNGLKSWRLDGLIVLITNPSRHLWGPFLHFPFNIFLLFYFSFNPINFKTFLFSHWKIETLRKACRKIVGYFEQVKLNNLLWLWI